MGEVVGTFTAVLLTVWIAPTNTAVALGPSTARNARPTIATARGNTFVVDAGFGSTAMRITGTFHTLGGEAEPSPQFNNAHESTSARSHATRVPTGTVAFTIRIATITFAMNRASFADPGNGVTNGGRI